MDFFDRMRNYIVYFLVFGVWSSWKSSEYRIWLQAYPLASLALLSLSYISSVKSFLILPSLSGTLTILLFSTTFLTHFFITIETIAKSETQLRIVQEFSIVDRMFETTLNIYIPYRREKEKLFVRNCVLVSFIVVLKGIPIVYFHLYRNELDFMYCLLYSKFIMHLKTIEVLFFVFLVRARLMLVNKEIIYIQQIQSMQSNQTNRQHARVERTMFLRILDLKKVFGELYEICELINHTFGWSLLSIVAHHFIQITCNCYWLFLFIGVEDVQPETGTFLITAGFLAPIFVMLIALTFYCSSCFDCVSNIFSQIIAISLKFEASFFYFWPGSYDRDKSASHSS